MEDRFKFRVWLKHSEKMIYIDKKEGDNLYSFLENVNDRQIIMQCIGLKDKNGKLIYEGDILEDPVHKFKVGWNEYSFIISGASKKGEEKQVYFFPLLARTFKVIGNIYENPELMEE